MDGCYECKADAKMADGRMLLPDATAIGSDRSKPVKQVALGETESRAEWMTISQNGVSGGRVKTIYITQNVHLEPKWYWDYIMKIP